MFCPHCQCAFDDRSEFCPNCGYSAVPAPQSSRSPAKQPKDRFTATLFVLLAANLMLCVGVLLKMFMQLDEHTIPDSRPAERVPTVTAASETAPASTAGSSAVPSDPDSPEVLDRIYLPNGLEFYMTPEEAVRAIYDNYSPLNSEPQIVTSITGTPLYEFFFPAPPTGFGKMADAFSDCPVRLQLFFDNKDQSLSQINLESECRYSNPDNWGCYGTEKSAVRYQQRALEAVTGFTGEPEYVEYPHGFKNGNRHQYRYSNSEQNRRLGICYRTYDNNSTVAYYSYWCYSL